MYRLHKTNQEYTSSVSKKAAYNNNISVTRADLGTCRNSWLSMKAEEIDRKVMKKFHDALQSSESTHFLLTWTHTNKTDKDAGKGVSNIMCVQSTVNKNTTNRLPQVKCNVLLDQFSTVTETRKANRFLSSGKAPVSDIIPTENYTAGGQPMAEKLSELFHYM